MSRREQPSVQRCGRHETTMFDFALARLARLAEVAALLFAAPVAE
jgi:hypothetical protein